MINSISYSIYSVKAMHDLAKQIHQIVSEAHASHPMLASLLSTLNQTLEKTSSAIGKNLGSALTSQIKQADSDRDEAFVALRDYTQAGLRRLNENYRLAAGKVYRVFEQHDLRLFKFSYAEQSAALKQLFKELQSPENQNALKVLHAQEWLKELEQAQAKFEELYVQRIKEGASIEKNDWYRSQKRA